MTRRLRPDLAPGAGKTVLATSARAAGAAAPVARPRSLIALELGPAFHGDLAAVELALVLEAGLLGLLPGRLARVAPREVVELPEGVGRQYKVPHGQRDEVDQHPHYVGP